MVAEIVKPMRAVIRPTKVADRAIRVNKGVAKVVKALKALRELIRAAKVADRGALRAVNPNVDSHPWTLKLSAKLPARAARPRMRAAMPMNSLLRKLGRLAEKAAHPVAATARAASAK